MTFKELAIGSYFECNRNVYIKRSTRTAYHHEDKGLWFYFRWRTIVRPIKDETGA